MKDEAFQELLKSVRQAGRLKRWRLKARPDHGVSNRLDVLAVRDKLACFSERVCTDDRRQRCHVTQLGARTQDAGWARARVAPRRGAKSARGRRGAPSADGRRRVILRLKRSM